LLKWSQLDLKCGCILIYGVALHLLLEIVAFCRELRKLAIPAVMPDCYLQYANAMRRLQKLDEAEELLYEGLAECGQEGPLISRVSGMSKRLRQASRGATSA
jgi:hypothetical protein